MSALRDIVARIGGDLHAGTARANVPGPGHSRADRSLSLWQTPAGRVVWYDHSGKHAPREIAEYLGLGDGRPLSGWARHKAGRQRESERRAADDRARRFCEQLWRGTRPLTGSPAETYLREARSLSAMPGADVRFHPDAPRSYDGRARLPGMVALVRDRFGVPCGLHVTALLPDGSGKALGARSRVMFGAVAGGAVRLAPLSGDSLAVAEGVETALAFAELCHVPSWAALSTSGLHAFTPPPGLRRLIVAADGDPTGLEAARKLAKRASAQCDVTVIHPRRGDFNDMLRERHEHA